MCSSLLAKNHKDSKSFVYLLWVIPLIRLVLPFGMTSKYSLLTLVSNLATRTVVVINKGRSLITASELNAFIDSGEKYNLVDARVSKQYEKDHVETAMNIPHEKLRSSAEEMDKDLVTITNCNKGVTGNAAQNILINKGFKKVYNISGGHKTFSKWKSFNE